MNYLKHKRCQKKVTFHNVYCELKKRKYHIYTPNEIKGNRQKGHLWTLSRSSVHPKHMQDASGCQCRCASLPAFWHTGLWSVRQLISLVKAFLREADPAPAEISARASLYFKGTSLNTLLYALGVVFRCDHLVPSQPHNYYLYCNKMCEPEEFA